MNISELKKLALLGIAGGLLLSASPSNHLYAVDQEGSAIPDAEANGCIGNGGQEKDGTMTPSDDADGNENTIDEDNDQGTEDDKD